MYEADEDDTKCKQFLRAFVEAFIIAGVWCAITLISYIWLSRYNDSLGNRQRISLPFYMYLTQALIGWILLAINGALGLVFFPFDLINSFFNRSKKITK
jgi:hypothetical protein